jgi:hypothetical protein
MAWKGMTRPEVELELRARIELCRGDYQSVCEERRRLIDTAGAAGANSDGVLALKTLISTRDRLRDAHDRYKTSTKAFGDYVLHGVLPRDE